VPRHPDSSLAAIKQAVDIVALVGDYLPLHRSGSRFKALCPFHDDHNPSLEVYPDRQSYKCWVCGAGGDIIEFVKAIERVEFPEALRMLAERAGIALRNPADRPTPEGPSKSELFETTAWAEQLFIQALAQSPEALAYLAGRGLSGESAERFRLGYAPEGRDWLLGEARRKGLSTTLLESAGLIVRDPEDGSPLRARFRGRVIFPIHDLHGRTLGFGGRILPATEQKLADLGKGVAKYLNSPETRLFQKRRTLYAADLARAAARQAGWVAVVEGYTDVIAAHQAGLANVVGTLGTALGDAHVRALRQLADRVVLVFDGDQAGQSAADRALEFFLGQEVDVRVLTLPENLDPCDFLLREGADEFRLLVDRSVDPLSFALNRAIARFDVASVEGARLAADWVLELLARVPTSNRAGLDLKLAKSLDTLARRLGVPVVGLQRRLKELRRLRRGAPKSTETGARQATGAAVGLTQARPFRLSELDPVDRELVRIALNDPSALEQLREQAPVPLLREGPLRKILQVIFELHGEGEIPTFDRVMLRLEDAAVKTLVIDLNSPIDPQPDSEGVRPASWDVRLANVLVQFSDRQRQDRLRSLEGALKQTDVASHPEEQRALRAEYLRLLNQRPGAKPKSASL
jgi:DNA primase